MEVLPTPNSRPTISLCLIAKNEEKNVNRLIDSVLNCFDEIILVDTGSTDKTKEIALSRGCKVFNFEWVNSFSAARNFAFSKAESDFIMWLDLDDVLDGRENFIEWRNHAMAFVDYWLASYHYAVDSEMKPIISFVRERVFRASTKPTWQYDIHEGVIPLKGASSNYITTWSVKHLRDDEDVKQDRSRNITMIERIKEEKGLDARLTFYYAKELYEAGRGSDAIPVFDEALKLSLEAHDRILACQYGGYAALGCFDSLKPEFGEQKLRYFEKALDFSYKGLRLDPNRAEFHVLIADAYLRTNDIAKAVPHFAAAKACLRNFESPYAAPVFSFKNLYGEAPSIHLAKIYAHLGLLDKAKKEAEECLETYGNEEAKIVIAEVNRVTQLCTLDNHQEQTEDIVFSCPPQNAYEFDEELYKTKGMGGSETALIHMAKHLKQKTGRNVKVFNMRSSAMIAESGVEYFPSSELNAYMSKHKPRVHIAWRHNIKVTSAPTYLWCHDLFTPGCEISQNFDKHLCLSPFHKNYVKGLQGIPEDKIIVTRNGIDPEKFKFERKLKNPNKLVWMSSPDRGLERCMLICDRVREEFPEVELHVYYGIEGLYKYGPEMSALADKLKAMMAERPYVKYHGFTEQSKMYQEVSDAVVWVHPNNFIETYAITAIECLANGIFPVVRRLGALADTLKDAESKRQAILLDYDWDDVEEGVKLHANAVCRVLLNRQWENITFDLNENSWGRVADSWIEFMGLAPREEANVA